MPYRQIGVLRNWRPKPAALTAGAVLQRKNSSRSDSPASAIRAHTDEVA